MRLVVVQKVHNLVSLFVTDVRARHRLHPLDLGHSLRWGRSGLQTLIELVTLLALHRENPVAILYSSREDRRAEYADPLYFARTALAQAARLRRVLHLWLHPGWSRRKPRLSYSQHSKSVEPCRPPSSWQWALSEALLTLPADMTGNIRQRWPNTAASARSVAFTAALRIENGFPWKVAALLSEPPAGAFDGAAFDGAGVAGPEAGGAEAVEVPPRLLT